MTLDEKVYNELAQLVSEHKHELFDKIAADRTDYINVVIENLYKEHNASAVLRTCDCYGIKKLHVIENENQYKVNRDIALGAGKWVDVETHVQGDPPSSECIKTLKNRGYKIIATTPHTEEFDIYNLPIDAPMAFFFGTEFSGLSDDVLEQCDMRVKVPMFGFTESFNISVSAAILLSAVRKRLSDSQLNWKLTPEVQIQLKTEWCIKNLSHGQEIESEIRRRLIEKEL
jgi:tRNA (guanosine-2'-O-)-methyltransferase